jgi:hypothetical protein
MVIDFSPEGQVQALHRDEFPLWFLGKMTVARASSIVFDEEAQRWGVHLHLDDGTQWAHPLSLGIDGYDKARNVEVAWLDQLRLNNLPPRSAESLRRLSAIREAYGV